VTLSLAKASGGGLFAGETTYRLVIANPGAEAQDVTLTHQIAASCVCSHPATAGVPAGGETAVDVKVKARNRRWSGGKQSVPFAITAAGGGDGGAPPATVNGTFDDSAMPLLPAGGGVLAIGAVAAIVGGMLLLGGGGDDDPQETASPAPSRSENLTPPPSATGGPTDGPVDTGIPPNSIVAGEWFFNYTVTDNTCTFGLLPGETAQISLFLQEVSEDDSFLTDGEIVDVFNSDSTLIDRFVFSYPLFEFTAPLISGDFVFHSLFFSSPTEGQTYTEEHYFEADGVTPCVITLEEF
jgi:hypothetical protein